MTVPAPGSTPPPSRGFHASLCGIALAAGLWRCWRLTVPSFDHDEAYEVLHRTFDLGELAGRHDGFPPLYRWIVDIVVEASGADIATRWLSLAAGVATVVVVGLWGRALAVPRVGLAAAALLAVSANHTLQSQYGRAYSLYILLVTLALAAAWRARDRGRASDWASLVCASWLALATHYYAALPIAVVGGLLLASPERKTRRCATAAAAALIIACLPLVVCLRADLADTGEFFHFVRFDPEAYAFSYYWLVSGNTLGPSVTELREAGRLAGVLRMAPWALAAGAAVLQLGLAGWRALRKSDRLWLGLLIIAPPLLAAAASRYTPTGYNYRYFVWMVAPVCLWLGAGLAAEWRRPRVTIAAVTLAGLGVFATLNRHFDSRYAENDFRAVAALIEAKTPAHDRPPAVAAAPTYFGEGVLYSLPADWPAAAVSAHPGAEQDWDRTLSGLAERAGDRGDVWLVTQWFPEGHPQREVCERLAERMRAKLVARVSSTVLVYRAPAESLTGRTPPEPLTSPR